MSFFSYRPHQRGMIELDMQDAFTFGCDMCGECCNAVERIVVLSGPDVARIAPYMKLSRQAFLDEYTLTLIDPETRIPSAVIRPEPCGGMCALLQSGRCRVHAVKPRTCALYPLSRGMRAVLRGGERCLASVRYTTDRQSLMCGTFKHTFTVEEWLRESNVPVDDSADTAWFLRLAALTEDRGGLDDRGLYHALYLSGSWD